eukprot:479496_1
MIAITRIFSKLFHTLISDEITQYVINNNYLSVRIQKAFLRNISGCIEHCSADAYPSIPHNLINFVLIHYHIPLDIATYISNLYNNLNMTVITPSWSTNSIPLNNGLFIGDTLSQIIFLMTFNILIEHIQYKYKNNNNVGYNLFDVNVDNICTINQFLKCIADD